jgi:hypothetical protein
MSDMWGNIQVLCDSLNTSLTRDEWISNHSPDVAIEEDSVVHRVIWNNQANHNGRLEAYPIEKKGYYQMQFYNCIRVLTADLERRVDSKTINIHKCIDDMFLTGVVTYILPYLSRPIF